MKFFSLIKEGDIRTAPGKKVITAEAFSDLLESSEVIKKAQEEAVDYRKQVVQDCEVLKEEAEKAGFEEGLRDWNEHIRQLEEEIKRLRDEMDKALVPLAIAAVKKIIGKEIEINPHIILDIISTALKTVSQRHRIILNVNPEDVKIIEENRPQLKELFEHLHTFSVIARADIERGGCIIETEAGIVNAQLSMQLRALEAAFHQFFQNHSRGKE